MMWPGILAQVSGEVPPAFCSVTLSGDLAPSFGALPAEVSGRTVFIEDKEPPLSGEDGYTALENPANFRTVGSGTRLVELDHSDKVAGVSPSLLVIAGDLGTVVIASVGTSGDARIRIESPIGTTVEDSDIQLTPVDTWPDTVAVSLTGSSGDIEVYVDGVPQNLTATSALYSALYSGQTAVGIAGVLGVQSSAANPVSATLPISVAASTMVSEYPVGTLDWCEDPLS